MYHHGIKGQKWGRRRYQNEDGSLTDEGLVRYGSAGFQEDARRVAAKHNGVAYKEGKGPLDAATYLKGLNSNKKQYKARAEKYLKEHPKAIQRDVRAGRIRTAAKISAIGLVAVELIKANKVKNDFKKGKY